MKPKLNPGGPLWACTPPSLDINKSLISGGSVMGIGHVISTIDATTCTQGDNSLALQIFLGMNLVTFTVDVRCWSLQYKSWIYSPSLSSLFGNKITDPIIQKYLLDFGLNH